MHSQQETATDEVTFATEAAECSLVDELVEHTAAVDAGPVPIIDTRALPGPGDVLHAETARAAAVAEFRRLADALDRGAIDGARIQWRDGLHHVETVVRHPDRVQLLRLEIHSPERPPDPPEAYDRDYDNGRPVTPWPEKP
jgi:hypothetical protein